MKTVARMLRANMTNAERVLWHHLRGRRLEGYKFRRQVIIDPYIVDFACLEEKLIIEADGGQHMELQQADQDRTEYLSKRGFRVLRFWNHEILTETEAVLEMIHRALIDPPHPNPSP